MTKIKDIKRWNSKTDLIFIGNTSGDSLYFGMIEKIPEHLKEIEVHQSYAQGFIHLIIV